MQDARGVARETLLIGAVGTVEVGVELLGASVVTALALGLAAVGRRRLAVGVAEGLFVAALSGLLLLNYAALSEAVGWGFSLSASLGGLAVLWLIAAVWVEKGAGLEGRNDAADRQSVRRTLAVHAAAVMGLLALAAAMVGGAAAGRPGFLLVLCLLLAVAGGAYVWRGGVLARYAAIGVVVTLVVMLVPGGPIAARRLAISLMLLLGGAATLLVVLMTILAHWRQRIYVWHTDAQRLTEPPPSHRRVYALVVAAGALVGVGGVLLADAALTPLAVALAALAVLTVGHRWRSNAVGELGLGLGAEAVITAACAWLPAGPASGLVGWSLAGVYMLWLARFWEQQLNHGRAWTTTGRLIPVARHLSYAAVGGQVLAAAVWALQAEHSGTSGGWQAILAVLLMLLHWSMLAREAGAADSSTAALAACLVLLAALVPIERIAEAQALSVPPAILLAAGGVVLAVSAGPRREAHQAAWVYNAYGGGIVPVAVLYDLTLRGTWATSPLAAMIAGLCVLLAAGLRWRVWRSG